MNKRYKPFEIIAIKYGVLTLIGLILYYLLMTALDLVYMVELRALNFIFLSTGLYFAIREYRNHHYDEMNYLKMLSLGVMATAIAVFPFALFNTIWLYLDTSFMNHIRETALFGRFLNPFILGFLILLEGLISGFIAGYGVMQYMKKPVLSNS